MSTRLLLTGGSGQLGGALAAGPLAGEAEIVAPTRYALDLADADAVLDFVRAREFHAVLNCGAYTAVDAAEADVLGAYRVNALAPAALATACREKGIPLIHISTDYVFAGEGEEPYRPGDPIAPLSVYGASKAAGELAVRASGCRHAILRTAWVVSATGRNFVRTMLALGRKQETLRVVADQFGSPTSADDLARAVTAVTARLLTDEAWESGTWHVANRGYATWHEVASHALASAGGSLANVEIAPITAADHPTPARRPANSRLDITAFEQQFGLEMPHWREAVDAIVRALEKGDQQ